MSTEKNALRRTVIKYLCTLRKELNKFWVALEEYQIKEFETCVSWCFEDMLDTDSFNDKEGAYFNFGSSTMIFLPDTTDAWQDMEDAFNYLYENEGIEYLVNPNLVNLYFDGEDTIKFKFYVNIADLCQEHYEVAKRIALEIEQCLKDLEHFSEVPKYFECDDDGFACSDWQECANYYVGVSGSYSRNDYKYESRYLWNKI